MSIPCARCGSPVTVAEANDVFRQRYDAGDTQWLNTCYCLTCWRSIKASRVGDHRWSAENERWQW